MFTLTRLVAGAMSGTSADGVDVAIVRVEGWTQEISAALVWHQHRPYEPSLRKMIGDTRTAAQSSLRDLAEMGRQISLVYSAAVNEALLAARLDAGHLACVAAHGQTLFHDPPLTIQWLDPSLIAAETGCTVVSDFRRADCAAGGQGAPLVPYADFALFRHARKNRVLLNIGGIANITFLPAGCTLEQVVAFDTGPGNCISDELARRRLGKACDEGGACAGRGQAIETVVQQVLAAPYFRQAPPKSTDGPAMLRIFETSAASTLTGGPFPAQQQSDSAGECTGGTTCDLLATACVITARAIGDAIGRFCGRIDEVVASGGGTQNRTMMGELARHIAPATILGTDELGIPSAAKEAIAFALLGLATLDGLPSNVPSATGAARAVVLGSVTPMP